MAKSMRFGLTLAFGMAWAAAIGAQSAPPVSLCGSAASSPAAASRIAGDWRASARVALAAAWLAVPFDAMDLGIASPGARLERMMLLLEPSHAQRTALDRELAALQDPNSCAYHRWLSPAQFADAYGNSASDVNAVTGWLRNEGFTVAPLPASRGWIEFSGTAGQVEQAFGAPVHALATPAGTRYFVRDALSVPAALAPLIHGLVSLDGALSAPALTQSTAVPEIADSAGTPQAVTAALGLDTLHEAGTLGTGQTIAIAARSNIDLQDVAAFRSMFNLPAAAPEIVPASADPGVTDDRAAATAMASWAGVAAPGARIELVPAATTAATDGVDLSLAAIVDGRLAGVAVVGNSACEPALSAAHRAFYSALYRQAAAEGISIVAATGDSGAAACHPAGSDAAVTTGYAVNGLASTPWNTAVGVAVSDGSGVLRAWRAAAGLPEYSSGGGVSVVHPLPGWQPALSTSANGRLLPDIVLPVASSSNAHGLAFCLSGASAATACTPMRSGGSALSAAIFGGIAALLNEKDGAQGNLAPGIYALRSRAGVFDDVREGSAKLDCAAGSPNCDTSGQIGYDAAEGYDLATGLGSVHADRLVSAWASPQSTGTGAVTVKVTLAPAATNNTYVPSAQITFTATVASQTGGGTPTGTVQFFNQTTNANLGSAITLTTSGTASLPLTSGLALGVNNVVAMYSGDSTYAALISSPVQVTIAKGATTTTLTASPTTLTAGIPETLTATVAPTSGTIAALTGTVSFYDGTTLLGTQSVASNTATLTNVTLSTTAPHQITAVYSGDSNWVTSTSAPLSLTAVLLADTVTLTAMPVTPAPGQVVTLTATVSPTAPPTITGEQNPTGSVAFYFGTTLLGSANLTASVNYTSVATLITARLPGGQDVVTAVYQGDPYYVQATSNPATVNVQDFSLAAVSSNPPTNLNIVKGQSGSASFVLTGLGGFSGQVQVVCSMPAQDDMTCTPSPQQVTPTATVTFAIQTFTTGGPASAMNGKQPMWPRAAGGMAFAALFLLILPGNKRRRTIAERAQRFVVLPLLLAAACGVGIGCQSVSGTAAKAEGTPLGVSTLTITATAYVNNVVVSHSVYLTVNVIPPG